MKPLVSLEIGYRHEAQTAQQSFASFIAMRYARVEIRSAKFLARQNRKSCNCGSRIPTTNGGFLQPVADAVLGRINGNYVHTADKTPRKENTEAAVSVWG